MDAIETGTFYSQRGVEVTVTRVPIPDAPGLVQQLQIQYGLNRRPGTIVWYPDVQRCWPRAQQVVEHFLEDRDNLGRTFLKKLPQRPLETLAVGDLLNGAEGMPQDVETAPPRNEAASTPIPQSMYVYAR